ncbi:hypothetical protein AVEN_263454-1, partial [Araneus ventricosus]
AFVHEGSS